MKIFYIYTLTSDRSKQVQYVGCTSTPSDRQKMHKICDKNTGKNVRVFEVLELSTDINDAARLEQYWINQMRAWGFKLENSFSIRMYRTNNRHSRNQTETLLSTNNH